MEMEKLDKAMEVKQPTPQGTLQQAPQGVLLGQTIGITPQMIQAQEVKDEALKDLRLAVRMELPLACD